MRTAAIEARGKASARTRLKTEDREQQILDGAIRFFSARGLDGQLRDLARDIGITHALLFHYFPTKQALVDRMYQQIFEGRWNVQWERLLDDREQNLEDKMTTFYCAYSEEVLTYEWVRILIFSGLSDRLIPDRFFKLLRQRLFPRLIRETRIYRGVSTRGKPGARELELLMGLHGSIFYARLRQWVYGQSIPGATTPRGERLVIRDRVRAYLVSAKTLLDGKSVARRPRASASGIPQTHPANGG
ncbi:MAG: helix-turn-helix domain-containing protein [Burkholderiaceae bacterium]